MERSKFTGYLGRVVGISALFRLCMKKSSPPFLVEKKSSPPFFSKKKSLRPLSMFPAQVPDKIWPLQYLTEIEVSLQVIGLLYLDLLHSVG